MSLFMGAVPYTAIIFSLVNPYLWSLFSLTVLVGLGGGVLWTANGQVCKALQNSVSCAILQSQENYFWMKYKSIG